MDKTAIEKMFVNALEGPLNTQAYRVVRVAKEIMGRVPDGYDWTRLRNEFKDEGVDVCLVDGEPLGFDEFR